MTVPILIEFNGIYRIELSKNDNGVIFMTT